MVGIAQLVRALVCGTRGRGFKSHYPPKENKKVLRKQGLFCCLFTGDSAYLYSLVLADEKTLLESPKKHSDIVKKCFMISLLCSGYCSSCIMLM